MFILSALLSKNMQKNVTMLDISVEKGLKTGNWSQLKEFMITQGIFQIKEEQREVNSIEEGVFSRVLQLLNDDSFLSTEGVHEILFAIQYEWVLVNEEQKGRLLPVLVASYARIEHYKSRYDVARLLGECFKNKESLEALNFLDTTTDSNKRLQIVLGFQLLSVKATEIDVAESAFASLVRLICDDNDDVRQQTEISLKRIHRFFRSLIPA